MSVIDKSILETTAKHEEDIGRAPSLEKSQYYTTMGAHRAEELEKKMTVNEAMKLWWPATIYSVAISTGIIMEGYDNLLLAQFYAMPSFCRKFGSMKPNGEYEVPAPWQAGLSNGCLAGEIIGLHINGYVIERFGYRKTLIYSLAALVCFFNILFFSQNIVMLLIGEILCGIPFGIFQTLTCAYASDVCPVKLRPFLTTYTNLCWVIGQLIGSGVLRGLVERTDQWGYRIPFALQWFWPIPISLAIFFSPESPWWLVRQGRNEEARKSLLKLTDPKGAPSEFSIDDTLDMIILTNNIEKAQTQGAGYSDCFKHTNARRTEISCITWVIQNLCGSAFMGYSTYFYVQAGLPTLMAFTMSLVQYGIGFIGTLASWYLMGKFGRRTLFGVGLFILFIILLGIGVAGVINNAVTGWVIGSLLVFYTLIYDCTVGPITYSLVSEIPSTRLKNKTVVLARNLFNIAGILNYVIVPFMLNPTAWNWGGKSGFFWAGVCSLCLVWTYFRLPEPRNRSYADLDELFERKISARNFSKAIVAPKEAPTQDKE